MYSKFQLATKYIKYLLTASNGKGHGVHSPFVFDFIKQVLNDDRQYYAYEQIEQLRGQLKTDSRMLTIRDFGAGSRVNQQKQRTVASIGRSALKPKKFGQLLFRIVEQYKPSTILELGTSLGITTAYLASASSASNVITLEGAPEVAAVARNNFKKLQLQNIQLTEGNFDETLETVLQNIDRADLAFIDGNHRLQPTLAYFQQLLPKTHEYSILIFDDIHWSAEMEQAWETIQAHDAVRLTIDLFFIGLVFFRSENKAKQHFSIRF